MAHRVGARHRRTHTLTRDVGLAEDLAQEALVAALEQWPHPASPIIPRHGLPQPQTPRIDLFRRNAVAERNTKSSPRLEALNKPRRPRLRY